MENCQLCRDQIWDSFTSGIAPFAIIHACPLATSACTLPLSLHHLSTGKSTQHGWQPQLILCPSPAPSLCISFVCSQAVPSPIALHEYAQHHLPSTHSPACHHSLSALVLSHFPTTFPFHLHVFTLFNLCILKIFGFLCFVYALHWLLFLSLYNYGLCSAASCFAMLPWPLANPTITAKPGSISHVVFIYLRNNIEDKGTKWYHESNAFFVT